MKTINTIACVFSFATLFISCSNENDATPVNEEELITTITAVFTPELKKAQVYITYPFALMSY